MKVVLHDWTVWPTSPWPGLAATAAPLAAPAQPVPWPATPSRGDTCTGKVARGQAGAEEGGEASSWAPYLSAGLKPCFLSGAFSHVGPPLAPGGR